jgi:transmembrane sensor
MTDQRFTELLGKKLADEISIEEQEEFILLLKENSTYRQEYESLSHYFHSKAVDEVDAMPLFEKIKARIESPESSESQVSNNRFGNWYRIAAILALYICAFGGYQLYHKKISKQATSVLVWKEINTPSRLTSKITLTDGTTVTLNSETQLKYPAEFKGDHREVHLTGEAFFDVKKDAQRPFIIRTEKLNIKVLGTSFDVKAYKNDPHTEATLITGAIQISMNDKPEKQILLKPQEKFSLQHQAANEKGSPRYTIVPLNDTETSWINHKLVFKNETFDVLANSISRWYGMKLIFKNESLKNSRFTGFFEKENIAQALKALQLIEPFRYKIEDKTVYIY